MYNISGNIYEDEDPTDADLCTTQRPLTGTAVRLLGGINSILQSDNVDQLGRYTLSGATNVSSPYALYVVQSGYSIIGVRNADSGNFIGTVPSNSYPLSVPLTGIRSFCLSNNTTAALPWFMTSIGSVRQQSISNPVPEGQSPTIGTTDASIFYSTKGDANLGKTSLNKWIVDQEYTRGVPAVNKPGNASFSFYKHRAETAGVNLNTLLPSCPTNGTGTCIISNIQNLSLDAGVYYYAGDIIITGDTTITNTPKRYVILAGKNITLQGNVRLVNTPNSIIIFAAKNNIIVSPTVGTTPLSSSDYNIQAILSAENNIELQSNDSCPTPDTRLNIEGTLIANADNPFGQELGGGILNNKRTLCAQNVSFPSLYVKSRLSFITQLSDFYKVSSKFWNEVAP
ncbi:MAG TPA: hypothetical protein PLD54_03260 [Candidatus Levybacteria bacterium]|nr:hypothetical protein [Candidatus Levybacteria bacterium]